MSTQEVDNLLAEEKEFYNAVDEIEHGIGINQSMFDWANINFNSLFGVSGEFEGRASIKCRKCDFKCENEEELREHKRMKKAEYRANNSAYNTSLQEGPLSENESEWEKCNFVSKNWVMLEEHKDQSHKGIRFTRCSLVSPDMEGFKKHGEK